MRTWLVIVLATLLTACSGEAPVAGSSTVVTRASLLLEPPTLGLGDVTTAVLLVTTAPDHRVLPVPLPELSGVWHLETLSSPIDKQGHRWLHRTRIRLRPREVGQYRFPEITTTIESSQGERVELKTAARDFEVVSIVPQYPARTAPFGLQELEAAPASVHFLLPAAIGAALTLALVGIVYALRRSAASADGGEEEEVDPPRNLLEWSQRELDRATAALEGKEPREAVNIGARFMRLYVESRFRAHAAAATTEELSAQKPPLAAHRYWPDLVSVLNEMDDLRWRPRSAPSDGAEDIERARGALDEARAFLDASSPRGRE